MHRRISLAIRDLAEQNIVLQRGRGVVALGVEELDLPLRLFRQIAAEDVPRLEQPLLHRLVEHVEAMARRDQPERQGQQLFALLPMQAGVAACAVGGTYDAPKFGQFLGADKAELLEEFMIGRQTGEHLGHCPRDLAAGLDQILGQPNLVEHRANISVVGERIEIENRADRRAEQQVFRDARVRVVALRIEGLDKIGDAVGD